jgi:esterase/lipase superfamily enzyme
MPTSMMITNRNVTGNQLGEDLADLTYYVSDQTDLMSLDHWTKLELIDFRDRLVQIARQFPKIEDTNNEQQKHVSILLHGYNETWTDAVKLYQSIQGNLYADTDGLGQLILFTWPSQGHTWDYLPDRDEAASSRSGIAQVFVNLHDFLVAAQRAAAKPNGSSPPCRAKISVIAHSMGNFVLQKALASAAKMLNSPQLITLIHQCAMVAADVDNDIFPKSLPLDSDGSLMANLCYRISALYTGRDQVLGASAGLKHFGTRRLGRSGLADPNTVHDNVFDCDVTNLIPANAPDIHSAVFENQKTLDLLRLILIGRDRNLLPVPPEP